MPFPVFSHLFKPIFELGSFYLQFLDSTILKLEFSLGSVSHPQNEGSNAIPNTWGFFFCGKLCAVSALTFMTNHTNIIHISTENIKRVTRKLSEVVLVPGSSVEIKSSRRKHLFFLLQRKPYDFQSVSTE